MAVELDQPFPINASGIRVVLRTKSGSVTLLDVRGDSYVSFADAWFSPDHRFVAVYACTAGPKVELAYDLAAGKKVEFKQFQAKVAQQIGREYGFTSSADDNAEVFGWACLNASDAFLKKYPHAKAF